MTGRAPKHHSSHGQAAHQPKKKERRKEINPETGDSLGGKIPRNCEVRGVHELMTINHLYIGVSKKGVHTSPNDVGLFDGYAGHTFLVILPEQRSFVWKGGWMDGYCV